MFNLPRKQRWMKSCQSNRFALFQICKLLVKRDREGQYQPCMTHLCVRCSCAQTDTNKCAGDWSVIYFRILNCTIGPKTSKQYDSPKPGHMHPHRTCMLPNIGLGLIRQSLLLIHRSLGQFFCRINVLFSYFLPCHDMWYSQGQRYDWYTLPPHQATYKWRPRYKNQRRMMITRPSKLEHFQGGKF